MNVTRMVGFWLLGFGVVIAVAGFETRIWPSFKYGIVLVIFGGIFLGSREAWNDLHREIPSVNPPKGEVTK